MSAAADEHDRDAFTAIADDLTAMRALLAHADVLDARMDRADAAMLARLSQRSA